MEIVPVFQAKPKNSKRKGIAPVISTIMIIGVLAGITGLAYQWGMPMMQKNVGTTELYSAENFLKNLDKKIDDIAKNGGSEEVVFSVPGELHIDPIEDRIDFSVETSGSIYAPGGFICFTRNCDLDEGVWGEDTYSVIGAQVSQGDDRYAMTTYSVILRNLSAGSGTYIYSRDIVTPFNVTLVGSEGARMLITKLGEERGNVTRTIIKIDLI
ncbi:MAG: hypothetical protein JW727_04370 [Candidatus Aenigmarchaeota archaeon]|nr:hypothetical protein [Candidatus Aenigmarchaeota archaeon]